MTIDLPSMLAFERKLETSDALMFQGSWESIVIEPEGVEVELGGENKTKSAWSPVEVNKRKNRGVKGSFEHGNKVSELIDPNVVEGEHASLVNGDTLKLSFSLRIIGNLGKPFGCNDPRFESSITSATNAFKETNGLKELAFRYAYNIANGRFLWRNRVGADEVAIHLTVNNDQAFVFNAYDFSLTNFDKNSDNANLKDLAEIIEQGLKGDSESFVLIGVDAYVKLGELQHVFPSQEMNMNEKGKTLFQLDGCAAMHNVKIGNAIRTIDTWYPRFEEVNQPIPIEPFGAVTQRGDAYRKNPSEGALYPLIVDWVNNKELSEEQKMFVVANLIRGGVFSKKSGS